METLYLSTCDPLNRVFRTDDPLPDPRSIVFLDRGVPGGHWALCQRVRSPQGHAELPPADLPAPSGARVHPRQLQEALQEHAGLRGSQPPHGDDAGGPQEECRLHHTRGNLEVVVVVLSSSGAIGENLAEFFVVVVG